MNTKRLILTVLGFLIFTIIVISSIYLNSNKQSEEDSEKDFKEKEKLVKKELIKDKYGIETDNYLIKTGVIKRNQNLSQVFSKFNLDSETIHYIAKEMDDVFPPRRIRAGNSYKGYFAEDSVKRLKYFVYDICPLTFLKIDLTDSLFVSKGEKETSIKSKQASGIINTSLWQAMSDNDLNFDLAMRLSEILAWEVDFYRIQKGDRFKVIFDELFVGDERVGIDRVHALYFLHRDREIYGFNFQKDTIDDFFDKEGENLRKVFLQAPLKFYRISSGYSRSRLHPIHGDRRPHLGTDYAAPAGTPIMAVGDGVITRTAYTAANGNYVRIRHNSVYETQYLHMSRFAKGMRPGVRVQQGDIIGYVGSTGHATGPHVCFRFWKNGRQVNHRRLEFPSADPLPEEYFEEFSKIRDTFKKELNEISFKDDDLPV